jgi:tRNA 2-thiouridine synthesizing protein D
MHFVISATWGPTDPTRAMLPFVFAASAVQAGDEVTLMLSHDAVYMAVEGSGAKLVPGRGRPTVTKRSLHTQR